MKSVKSYYLYKIVNSINDKVYIGMSGDVEKRKYQHFKHRSKKTISIIQLAIDKHGPENFEFIILCEGSREYIIDLEKKAIVAYDSINNGYNIRSGGEGGSGHKISNRSDDAPMFVSGFWFPNLRTCLSCINLSKNTIYNLLRDGSAGDVVRKNRVKYPTNSPVYVGGFWFDNFYTASSILNKTIPALRKRIYDGFIEQMGNPETKGPDHPTYGKTGELCPNSKPIYVDGILYVSRKQAVEQSNYSACTISRGLKNKDPRFSYKINENVEV